MIKTIWSKSNIVKILTFFAVCITVLLSVLHICDVGVIVGLSSGFSVGAFVAVAVGVFWPVYRFEIN